MKVVYRVVSDFQRFSAPGTKMKVLYERLVDLPKQPPWTGEPIETLADALAFQILIETPADKPLRWMQEERIGNHSQHTSLDLSVSWWSAWLDRHQEARLQTKAAALKYAMRREMTPDIQDIMRFLAVRPSLPFWA